MIVSGTIIDQRALVSILSSTTWKVLGSPSIFPETKIFSSFNGGTNRPLGILPKLQITLKRKTVHLNVMVVQGLLDYNLLLGRDYIYSMEAIVSTFFRVMCFPHEGRLIQLVDQLSFPGSNTTMNQSSSLNGLFTSMTSLQPSFHPLNYRE